MVQLLFIFSDIAFTILRVVLGAVLLAHSMPKLKDLKKTAENFEMMGFRPGKFWGTFVALVEVLVGLFFTLGFFTQIAAAVVAVEFIVILISVKKFKKFTGGYELDLLILAGALVLLTVGGGAWSLDSVLKIILY